MTSSDKKRHLVALIDATMAKQVAALAAAVEEKRQHVASIAARLSEATSDPARAALSVELLEARKRLTELQVLEILIEQRREHGAGRTSGIRRMIPRRVGVDMRAYALRLFDRIMAEGKANSDRAGGQLGA